MSYFTLGTFIELFNQGGYVCNFNNRTFGNFATEIVGFNLQDTYGGSKFSSLSSFVYDKKISDKDKYNLLKALIENHKSACANCELDKTEFLNKCEQKEKELDSLFPNLSLTGDLQTEKIESLIEIHNTSYWTQQIQSLKFLVSNGTSSEMIGKTKEVFETYLKERLKKEGKHVGKNIDFPTLLNEHFISLDIEEQLKNDYGDKPFKFLKNMKGIGSLFAELRNDFGSGHGKEADFKELPKELSILVCNVIIDFLKYLISLDIKK